MRSTAHAPVVRLPATRPRDNDPSARASPLPELNCIRDRLSPGIIAAAERRSIGLGVGADRVLIAHGYIDEEAYLIALARWLGWEYERFEHRGHDFYPFDHHWMIEAARCGMLPVTVGGELELVVAPRSVRRLLEYAATRPGIQIRLTSAARLNRFVTDFAGQALGDRAANALLQHWPELSSGKRHAPSRIALMCLAALVVGALFMSYGPTIAVVETLLTAFFLSWLALRLLGSFLAPAAVEHRPLAEHDLPVYTIIVPLHREARAVEALAKSLLALDYPPEKLDIKLVVERDDPETPAALDRLKLGVPFEIIVAPQVGPQTKPKALNAALPFARGTFTVIYDAEDRPERDQLRRAVEMFVAEAGDVACVQARLTIDNTNDGWLARLFTAEYAAQFDLFLPGLARMGLPLPLGGSSNHFRTDVLRKVGAWDAYNVTEDADLGMRLARFGYRSVMLESTTYEEAPAKIGPWVRQRTRWFKGWMQTWCVHMRRPVRLCRQLGWRGFATLQLVVGGNVLAALIHPFFVGMFVYAFATGEPLFGVNGIPEELTWAFMATFFGGYLVTAIVGVRALAHRGLLSSAWWLPLVAFHWLLLSYAAWRALIQLLRHPYKWEKTEHGLAKSSRLAQTGRSVASDASTGESTIRNGAQRRDAA